MLALLRHGRDALKSRHALRSTAVLEPSFTLVWERARLTTWPALNESDAWRLLLDIFRCCEALRRYKNCAWEKLRRDEDRPKLARVNGNRYAEPPEPLKRAGHDRPRSDSFRPPLLLPVPDPPSSKHSTLASRRLIDKSPPNQISGVILIAKGVCEIG